MLSSLNSVNARLATPSQVRLPRSVGESGLRGSSGAQPLLVRLVGVVLGPGAAGVGVGVPRCLASSLWREKSGMPELRAVGGRRSESLCPLRAVPFVRRHTQQPARTVGPCSSPAPRPSSPRPSRRCRAAPTTPSRSPRRTPSPATGSSPPFPAGLATAVFALGCFWGEEKAFWQVPGVWSTAVGYAGGSTPAPDVRGGLLRADRPRRGRPRRLRPGEGVVRAAAAGLLGGARPDPGDAAGQRRRHAVPLGDLLRLRRAAGRRRGVAAPPSSSGSPTPATARSPPTIAPAGPFYYAEGYHQQYLVKNPYGYCPDNGTGVSCPVGLFSKTEQSD